MTQQPIPGITPNPDRSHVREHCVSPALDRVREALELHAEHLVPNDLYRLHRAEELLRELYDSLT